MFLLKAMRSRAYSKSKLQKEVHDHGTVIDRSDHHHIGDPVYCCLPDVTQLDLKKKRQIEWFLYYEGDPSAAFHKERGVVMVVSQQNGTEQAVQVWLTNIQISLLSDIDAVRAASILEHAQALLPTRHETHEATGEDQVALELQVGSRLDRGIQRKNRPNEDSLFVTQGILHSSSAPPKSFALFIVADGMGGQTNGQEASQLAVESLVENIYTSLSSQQMLSDTFLPLLSEGVQYANHKVYQYNQEHR